MPDQDKPAPVSFNLDTVTREASTVEPFIVVLKGKRYQLVHPEDLPWREMMSVRTDTARFLEYAVQDATRDDFLAALGEMPSWKVRQLGEAYAEHHGMVSQGE